MSLTEQDREALAVALHSLIYHPGEVFASCDEVDEDDLADAAHIAPAVEAIVARHIEAFRAEVVAALEEVSRTPHKWMAYPAAARIVRTHQQPPTPPEASALRVEGGGGR
ncbi:MAG: hypothetical protein ACXVXW_00700 [Mycobacteriaceae bacterium]